jgi:Protein of unknown function (DUF3435)
MRILGQSGNMVFEQHYQDSFIVGLQRVVLARPPQAALCKEARRIRNRDPLAPKNLSDEQREVIAKDPRILELRKERIDLRNEMRSLAGTIEAAKDLHPELYEKHGQVCRKLQRARKSLMIEAKREMKEKYFDNMPVAEVDKQIDRLLCDADTCFSENGEDEDEGEDWEPPTPTYIFEQRARIVEAFFGPDAETLDDKPALLRRIQVTKDMIALCGLCEPSRQRGRFNWKRNQDPIIINTKEGSNTSVEDLMCPIDICIVCARKFPRIDSLRRHLITQHLSLVNQDSGIQCTRSTCKNFAEFKDAGLFLNHAATIHKYDIKITPRQLDRFYRRSSPKCGLSYSQTSPESDITFCIDPTLPAAAINIDSDSVFQSMPHNLADKFF